MHFIANKDNYRLKLIFKIMERPYFDSEIFLIITFKSAFQDAKGWDKSFKIFATAYHYFPIWAVHFWFDCNFTGHWRLLNFRILITKTFFFRSPTLLSMKRLLCSGSPCLLDVTIEVFYHTIIETVDLLMLRQKLCSQWRVSSNTYNKKICTRVDW